MNKRNTSHQITYEGDENSEIDVPEVEFPDEVSISRTMIVSISRTMVQAGVSVLLTSSSSSSTLTLSAQTTFATSTKASKF